MNLTTIKNYKVISVIWFVFLFNSCTTTNKFEQISLDWSKDYMAELSKGFEANSKYKDWALLRSGLPNKDSVSILFKTSQQFKIDSLLSLEKGFFRQGHQTDWYYYLLVQEKDSTKKYITEYKDFINFLGKINSMQEALMIAKINGFQIDEKNVKGSSFIKTNNGFDFLLMKSENGNMEFRQYLVNVDKKGFVKSEKKKIYCSGYEDCYK